ncbi:MAG: hypothetical protein FJ026_00360 [Chloroflexi bacterium]|nr:hypothetical protein [Chloroflexota bacterium]
MDIIRLGLGILLTLLSGWGDSKGFLHSARVWQQDGFVWFEAARASLGYGCGILLYWVAIRYLRHVGIVSAEAQTLLWFLATIVGVAAASARFRGWQPLDWAAALGAVICLAIFILRTGS